MNHYVSGMLLVLLPLLTGCSGSGGNGTATDSVAKAWGTAQLLETDNAGGATIPQVAVDGSGNAVVVWEQSDGTRFNIVANHYW